MTTTQAMNFYDASGSRNQYTIRLHQDVDNTKGSTYQVARKGIERNDQYPSAVHERAAVSYGWWHTGGGMHVREQSDNPSEHRSVNSALGVRMDTTRW